MAPLSNKDAEREATRLLRENGYTWDGREKSSVSTRQHYFERHMVKSPFRGYSRPAAARKSW